MSERETEIIYVQSSHLGMIIGRGGATIKEITQDSGCRINIKKDEVEGDKTPVSLEGSYSAIQAAKARIAEITERSQNRQQNGGDRSYGNNDIRRDDERSNRY